MYVWRATVRAWAFTLMTFGIALLAGCSSYDQVTFQIQTGNDNADSNLEIYAGFADAGGILNFNTLSPGQNAFCLKESTGIGYGPCQFGPNAPTFNNGQIVTVGPLSMPTPLSPSSPAAVPVMFLSILQPLCGSNSSGLIPAPCSNWDLQAITATLSASKGIAAPFTRTYGTFLQHGGWTDSNCIARLKAPPNATTIAFTLTGTPSMTYVDGTSSEQGHATACKNNGDN